MDKNHTGIRLRQLQQPAGRKRIFEQKMEDPQLVSPSSYLTEQEQQQIILSLKAKSLQVEQKQEIINHMKNQIRKLHNQNEQYKKTIKSLQMEISKLTKKVHSSKEMYENNKNSRIKEQQSTVQQQLIRQNQSKLPSHAKIQHQLSQEQIQRKIYKQSLATKKQPSQINNNNRIKLYNNQQSDIVSPFMALNNNMNHVVIHGLTQNKNQGQYNHHKKLQKQQKSNHQNYQSSQLYNNQQYKMYNQDRSSQMGQKNYKLHIKDSQVFDFDNFNTSQYQDMGKDSLF